MIIRNAKLEELPYIREQRVRSYKEHSNIIPEDHWQALKQSLSSEADLQQGVERIVVEINKEIVGSVLLFPAKSNAYNGQVDELDYPEIRMLAVSPESRGKGVAKILIKECIERAKKKGHRSIGLHTGQFMSSAIGLYESLGFKRLPQYDFVPADDGIIVKAFQLTFY